MLHRNVKLGSAMPTNLCRRERGDTSHRELWGKGNMSWNLNWVRTWSGCLLEDGQGFQLLTPEEYIGTDLDAPFCP